MCSIGPLHQVYVFQHTFNDADIEAKPLQKQNTNIGGSFRAPTSMILSDNEQKSAVAMTNRHETGAVSDTYRSTTKGRRESSSDELPRTLTVKNETRNRRLAVVNKILDDMDDVIVSRYRTKKLRNLTRDSKHCPKINESSIKYLI
jgi:hypothetical protein